MIAREGGENSFNFFGIKAGVDWQGERVGSVTHEYVGGERTTLRDEFRAYRSIAQSFDDYVAFIKGNQRYSNVIEAAKQNDIGAYVNGLQKSGYATDPQYANKIKSIVDRGSFNDVVASLQGDGRVPL